jgi:hypothetical protein
LKPAFHFIGSTVETGAFKLLMSTGFNFAQPHQVAPHRAALVFVRHALVPALHQHAQGLQRLDLHPAVDHLQRVAVQVEFGKQILKPVSHFTGYQGLKPGAFKLWVNWIQLVQPHQ